MHVHFCGVRGSSPAPGREYVGVGGHTSCVAIGADGQPPTLVLDAGTGLRNLTTLLGGRAFTGTLILGHLHWDHIMGLPFFAAGDRPDAEVHLMLPEQGLDPLDVLKRIMAPPLFPITPLDFRGDWKFTTYGEGQFDAGPFSVLAREIPHRGGRTMGLRISDGRAVVAYICDHSPHDIGPGADGLGDLHPAAVELAADADLLIHDAQYTAAELPGRANWGHSAAQYCITLGQHCNVKRVFMYHHDATRTDEQVHSMRDELAAANGFDIEIAIENSIVEL